MLRTHPEPCCLMSRIEHGLPKFSARPASISNCFPSFSNRRKSVDGSPKLAQAQPVSAKELRSLLGPVIKLPAQSVWASLVPVWSARLSELPAWSLPPRIALPSIPRAASTPFVMLSQVGGTSWASRKLQDFRCAGFAIVLAPAPATAAIRTNDFPPKRHPLRPARRALSGRPI